MLLVNAIAISIEEAKYVVYMLSQDCRKGSGSIDWRMLRDMDYERYMLVDKLRDAVKRWEQQFPDEYLADKGK